MKYEVGVKGRIFDIKKFAIHDGPGIRSTVFLKGCPLRCQWCHNPESIDFEQELAFFPHKCIDCGKCIESCPAGALSRGEDRIVRDASVCTMCGTCVSVCPAEAIVCYGRDADVGEVLDEVMKDKPFYDNSGGGMTLSGGEPLAQHAFALALLQGGHERGLHCVLDTSGCSSSKQFQSLASEADEVLFDVKAIDEGKHKDLTGVSNRQILENLRWLMQTGKPVTLRVPLVPGLNDSHDDLDALASLVDELNCVGRVNRIEILAYHRIGSGKYESLSKHYGLTQIVPHTKEQIREIVKYLESKDVDVYCSSVSN